MILHLLILFGIVGGCFWAASCIALYHAGGPGDKAFVNILQLVVLVSLFTAGYILGGAL